MSFRSIPAQPTGRAQPGRAAGTRLSGRGLILIRLAWIVLVVCILVYFIASLPQTFVTLLQPCSGAWCTNATGRLTASQMHSLVTAGISLYAYAWSWIVITGAISLVWFGVGGILFWRKSDDWMVLLVALMLISAGADNVTNTLLYSSSFWRIPENGLYLIVSLTLLYTFALFPNGRFVPRWSLWVTLVYPTYVVCYLLFLRPLRIPGWALYDTPINAVTWFGSYTILILAQVYRYFRVSNAVERQQTKWVALGFFVVLVLGLGVTSIGSYLSDQHNGLLYALFSFSSAPFFLIIPLAIGFAMLRSRLWDIDVIINKALVYGLLSALLAAVYAGLIIGLQFLLGGIIKQNNDVAIVVSTLAIAALFQPLRSRIQRVIDHRFYRRKYDAARTLASFSATLRTEVDLPTLSEHPVRVVEETMQPTSVSLWLRPPAQRGNQRALAKYEPNATSSPARQSQS
jgi:hypothetical protein